MLITIGVDPSLVASGVVVIRNNKLIDQQLIKSKPTGDLPMNELVRILDISNKIIEIVEKHFSEKIIVCLEGMAYLARNTSALIQLAALNYFIRALLFTHKIPFVIVAPTSLKKFATGKGNCPKDNIIMEIYKRWHVTITNNNIADSYILARIGQSLLDIEPKLTIPQKEVINLLKKQL